MAEKIKKSRIITTPETPTPEQLARIGNAMKPFKEFATQMNSLFSSAVISPEALASFTDHSENPIPNWQIDEIAYRVRNKILNSKDASMQIDLILDEKGYLYQLGQERFKYKVGSERRLKFLQSLTDEFIPTDIFWKDIGCPTRVAFYKLKDDLNKKIRTECGLKNNLIDFQDIVGVRVNPQYTILLPD